MFDLDNLASVLNTPTSDPSETRSKKASVNNGLSSYAPSPQYLTINEQFSRLSPDLSSDGDGGATNDADSILSFDSHKSTTVTSEYSQGPIERHVGLFRGLGMPVLEDGLSDSENLSGDETCAKPNARHQSTQSDFHKTARQPPVAPVKPSYTAAVAAARPPLPPREESSTVTAGRSTSFDQRRTDDYPSHRA